MPNIFRYFESLLHKKERLVSRESGQSLEELAYDESICCARSTGTFPDIVIRSSKGKKLSGGELIEVKDSKTYSIPSFNSTIPTGKKPATAIAATVRRQMAEQGEDVKALPERDVYYLIRGRKGETNTKICLVHGSFFQTVPVEDLVAASFGQVLDEVLGNRSDEYLASLPEDLRDVLTKLFSVQENFSRVRNVDRASVKLRFRVMTEVRAEGNILNSQQYPEVGDNTISLILPHDFVSEEAMSKADFSSIQLNSLKQFVIKHHFNGYFKVLQDSLKK